MSDLHEIEAIKRLKYKYVRCLDQKRWDELAETLAEDATAAYSDGQYSFNGREQILRFLREALGPSNMICSHRVHQPEIDLTGADSAVGVWALDDVVIETKSQITIRGSAFYRDEYVKVGGEWRIKSTGYSRIYEEMFARADLPSLRLSANRWAAE
jgi:hypothetical protein